MKKSLTPESVKNSIKRKNTTDRAIRDSVKNIKHLIEAAKKNLAALREASLYDNIYGLPQMKLMFDVHIKSLMVCVKSVDPKLKHYFKLIGLDAIELTEHKHNNLKPPQTAKDHQERLKLLGKKILKNLTEIDLIIYFDYHSEVALKKITQTYRVYMPRLIRHTEVYEEIFSSFIELSRKEREKEMRIDEITPDKILATAEKLNQKLPKLVIKK
jgi:hypothetical protein